MAHEQREHQRFTTYCGSVVNIHGKHAYSTITNVSEEGIAFICAPELLCGDKVEVSFDLQQGTKKSTFSVIVEIVRCVKNDFEYFVGAKIQQMTNEFHTFVEQTKNSFHQPIQASL
ncbi:MAG: PilZ domain-containing protein [Pseudomonadota bacterium]|nr:PilZ domain-containing protein [Pseudomonadota bacterium]